MCLLTFLPAGVQPNLDSLRTGADHNPDGHGYAIVAGDRLLVGRGMDADAVIAEFARHRSMHPDGPAIFHSRWSTHGRVDLANCHPLPVGGDARTVIAHNGVLPVTVRPARGDPRSDTRIAAEAFIPTLGPLRLARTRARLQRWIGPDNKIAILTVDPAFRKPAYLLNEDQGIWYEQIWYSNDGFLPGSATQLWPDRVSCPRCGSETPAIDDECWICGTCLDCGEQPDGCFCYTPAGLDSRHAGRTPVDDVFTSLTKTDVAAWWAGRTGR